MKNKRMIAALTAAMCCMGTMSVPLTAMANDPEPKTRIAWFMEENNIKGRTYDFIKNGRNAVCIEVETVAEAEKIKEYIEKYDLNKDDFGLFAKENEGIDLLKSKEENILNVDGYIRQYMNENNIDGYSYFTEGNSSYVVVCGTNEGISQVKAFVKEKGYNADRIEYKLSDLEINVPEEIPENLAELGIMIGEFMKINGIGGTSGVYNDVVRVVLDRMNDQNVRIFAYYMEKCGIDKNKVIIDAVSFDMGGGWNDGQTSVKKNILGDANCDIKVDISDSVLVMQALANPDKYGVTGSDDSHITAQGWINSDMNGDGITVFDAKLIQIKLLGLYDTSKSVNWHMPGNGDYDKLYKAGNNGISAVITNTDELKEYLAQVKPVGDHGEDATLFYLEKYPESFFKDYVLLVDALLQSAGSTPGFSFEKTDISENGISITLDDGLSKGDMVESMSIAQLPVAKDSYTGQNVSWNVTHKFNNEYHYDKAISWYMNNIPSGAYDITTGNGCQAVITSTDQLNEFIAKVVPQDNVSAYAEKYTDDFFKDNVLLINAFGQGAGTALLYEFGDVDISGKGINITLVNQLEYGQAAAAVMSMCVAQIPVAKKDFNDQAVNWKFTNKADKPDPHNNVSAPASVSPSSSVRVALKCKAFIPSDEKLDVDVAMLGIPTNSFYDDDLFVYDYYIYPYENSKITEDERLTVNGEAGGYTKEYTGKDRNIFNVGREYDDLDTYHHETASLDFSKYPAGSTGSIVFGLKAVFLNDDGSRPEKPSFEGGADILYFCVGENGVGLSNTSFEAAKEACMNKSSDDVTPPDKYTGRWHGKNISYDLYEALKNNNGKNIAVMFSLKDAPDSEDDFVYNGRTIKEYKQDTMGEDITKMENLLNSIYGGDQLKYGEKIYTSGTPDGTKWTKEIYDITVESYGEELLSKYIVDGEFLKEQLAADLKALKLKYQAALGEAWDAFEQSRIDETIKQLEAQGIKCERAEDPHYIVMYITAEQFDTISLDNASYFTTDITHSVVF